MGTAVVLAVVIVGLLLVPKYPLAALAVVALGYGISRKVGGRSEAAFMAALMVLAGLGAVAVVGQYLTAAL